jgi:hypothetical protein
MSHLIVKKPIAMIIRIALLSLAIMSSPVALGADKQATITPDEIVAELKTKLDLNEQQVKELTTALTTLSQQLDALIAKREAATEDDDPNEFIHGVKQAQADYQNKLKKILSSSQLESYNTLREKVIMDAMKDLAEIRLLDIQTHVNFSDEQLQKLIPVLAESMRGFMKIAWKYAGERLRLGQKIRIARDLKRIQSKAQKQVQQILTEDQFKKWGEYKEQQQDKK